MAGLLIGQCGQYPLGSKTASSSLCIKWFLIWFRANVLENVHHFTAKMQYCFRVLHDSKMCFPSLPDEYCSKSSFTTLKNYNFSHYYPGNSVVGALWPWCISLCICSSGRNPVSDIYFVTLNMKVVESQVISLKRRTVMCFVNTSMSSRLHLSCWLIDTCF